MIVEIISVGTELLLGNIVNTNAQFISKELAKLGMECYYQTVVGDNQDRIKSALDVAFSRGDMVILTGGLGPTKDDLTKEMLMDYFHKEVVLDEKAWEMMKERMTRNGFTQFSDSQKKQAYVPKDSIVMYNHNGTAPGCIMENNGKYCMLFPGPPKEMQPMFKEYGVPYLRQFSDKVFVSMDIKMMSRDEVSVTIVGEGPCAERLGDLCDNENPTVATYAKEDGCLIRITAAAQNREEALKLIEPILEQCKKALGEKYIKRIFEDK